MPDRIAPPVSDADRTLQLPSADQTVTDFVAVNAGSLRVAVDVELSEPAAVDGTQELGGADILEVEQIAEQLDTEPSTRIEVSMDPRNKNLSDVFGALPRRPMGTLVGVGVPRPPRPPPMKTLSGSPVMLPPPRDVDPPAITAMRVPAFPPAQRSLPPLPVPVPPPRSPSEHPSRFGSVAPLALDIGVEPAPIDSTIQLRRAAGIPDRARPELAIAAGIGAWAVMAAGVVLVLGGTFVGIKRHSAAKASAAHAQVAAPRAVDSTPEIRAVEEKVAEPAVESPPAPVAAVALPPPRPAAAPKTRPSPATPKSPVIDHKGGAAAPTGVLRVPAGVRGVLVDGAPHKVDGGAVLLPCGKHMIKAPGQPSRSVDIGCGKSVSL